MRLYSNVYDYDIYTLNYYEDQYFISLFKHTVKIYDQCTYAQIIIKKILPPQCKKKFSESIV